MKFRVLLTAKEKLTGNYGNETVVYLVNEDTSEFYAEILNNLRGIGKPVPTNDIWIAAVAFQNGLKLFAKDMYFKAIAGLSLVG